MFPIELDAEPKRRHSEQWNSRGETFRPFEHSWLPGKQIPARRTSKQLPSDSSQSVRSVMQTELMKRNSENCHMTYWNLMIPMLAHSQLLLYCGTHGGKRADKTHKTPTRCLARPKSKYTSRHSPAKCSAIGTCPVVQALSWRANCCAVRNKQGEITKLSVHRL